MADQSSSTSTPITPARFAAALKDLSAENLALKVFELRNSIAHLDYSNAELRPYAEGLVVPISTTTSTTTAGQTASPSSLSSQQQQTPAAPHQDATPEPQKGDQDCIDAIAENQVVIARMLERIDLIRAEVLERGLSWDELSGLPPARDDPAVGVVPQGAPVPHDVQSTATGPPPATSVNGVNGVNGTAAAAATTTTNGGESGQQHEAWRDGTFTTGTIRAGGPGLSDEELLRRLQEQIPGLSGEDDDRDEEGGMHL